MSLAMRAIILVAGKSIFCRYWEDMALEETLAFCKCFVAEAGRSHLDFFLLLSYDLEQRKRGFAEMIFLLRGQAPYRL